MPSKRIADPMPKPLQVSHVPSRGAGRLALPVDSDHQVIEVDSVQPLLIVSFAANSVIDWDCGPRFEGGRPNQLDVPRSERGARRGAAPRFPLLLRIGAWTRSAVADLSLRPTGRLSVRSALTEERIP